MTNKTIASIALLCVVPFFSGTASALCVGAPEANLRQGPGTHYKKSWEVFKYMPLKKIGQKGKWYHVKDVDGDRHWVYGPLLTKAMHCAVVKTRTANIRSGPGTGFAKAQWSPVEKYYSFRILGTKGNWVRVQDEVFNDGWVAKSLLWTQ
ncbi:MAG: SH3 domain-containing protein [Gallionellaceae bacterium]|nr:SH3 domain-containing protein [Gallionellaceae bacterium]